MMRPLRLPPPFLMAITALLTRIYHRLLNYSSVGKQSDIKDFKLKEFNGGN